VILSVVSTKRDRFGQSHYTPDFMFTDGETVGSFIGVALGYVPDKMADCRQLSDTGVLLFYGDMDNGVIVHAWPPDWTWGQVAQHIDAAVLPR